MKRAVHLAVISVASALLCSGLLSCSPEGGCVSDADGKPGRACVQLCCGVLGKDNPMCEPPLVDPVEECFGDTCGENEVCCRCDFDPESGS